jgi:hypothetical protein
MHVTPHDTKLFLFSRDLAEANDLPIALVCAIIEVESAGDPNAWRAEPTYRWLVNAESGRPFRTLSEAEQNSEAPPDDFPACPGIYESRATEWWGQQSSWGAMQVIGGVAREHGFRRAFPSLCDPYTGVRYGCLHLSALRDRFFAEHGWRGVAAAYNAGSPRLDDSGRYVNAGYVAKVAKAGGFA